MDVGIVNDLGRRNNVGREMNVDREIDFGREKDIGRGILIVFIVNYFHLYLQNSMEIQRNGKKWNNLNRR